MSEATKNPSATAGVIKELKRVGSLPPDRKVCDVKIVQIMSNSVGQITGLGADSKVYLWDIYLSGWIMNAMTDEEKDNHDIQRAAAAMTKKTAQ